jgi:hypothetical protein
MTNFERPRSDPYTADEVNLTNGVDRGRLLHAAARGDRRARATLKQAATADAKAVATREADPAERRPNHVQAGRRLYEPPRGSRIAAAQGDVDE